MSILLDTNAILFFLSGDHRLTPKARRAIENPRHRAFISIASFWEIAIKQSIGKLEMNMTLTQLNKFILAMQIETLDIEISHLNKMQRLPFHHRDPFDRLIIAQAKVEKLPVVTSDITFKSYRVRTIM